MMSEKRDHIWSYRKNHATGAHRIRRRLESMILADGTRLQVAELPPEGLAAALAYRLPKAQKRGRR